MKKSVLIAIFIFLSFATSFAFDEHRPWTYQLWDLELKSSFYNANANYSRSGGSYDRLADGNSYQLLTTDIATRYVISRSFAISAGFQVGYAESKNIETTRTNSALTEVRLSVEALLQRRKSYDLIAEFNFVTPLEKVSTNEDKVLTGEGATEAGGLLLARARWSIFHPFLFVGYTYRDSGRAALAPYGTGAEIKLASSFLGGEVRGYQSVSKDDYTDSPAARELVALRNGGALHFYSVNPNLLEANFWWRLQPIHGLGVKILGGSSVTGSATSAGWKVAATLNYRFSNTSEETKLSQPAQPFEIPTDDGVDQGLFKEPSPAPAQK